jgi:hypothetical protein
VPPVLLTDALRPVLLSISSWLLPSSDLVLRPLVQERVQWRQELLETGVQTLPRARDATLALEDDCLLLGLD